jgi:hypothetical protein
MYFPFRQSPLRRGTDRKAPIPHAAIGQDPAQSRIIAHPATSLLCHGHTTGSLQIACGYCARRLTHSRRRALNVHVDMTLRHKVIPRHATVLQTSF